MHVKLSGLLPQELTVFFGRFDPRPSDSGTFTFEMELHVTSVLRLLGSPFTPELDR